MIKTKKIGLALGSGGFRGFALIGVLQALEENKIPIDFISGSSIGSLIAAHYALFQDIDLLKRQVIYPDNKFPTLLDLGLRGGLVRGKKFENVVNRMFESHTFSETKIPLRVVATDLASGQAYYFKDGRIACSVQASCTVPVLFEPVKLKGHRFIDGGISEPVPIRILKKLGADVVIAVNLYNKNEFINKKFTLTKVALRSARIALYNFSQEVIKEADVVLAPDTSFFMHTSDYKKYLDPEVVEEMIEIGYKETMKSMRVIKRLTR